jgi:hypothetical protein
MSNSLQDSLSPRDVIDQIILSLNSDIGNDIVYILVEGKDDCKIYKKLFDEKNVNIEFVPGGKGSVYTALNELNNITRQIIGICDADFNHLQKTLSPFHNLFFTDFHDIEMTMLSFDEVLNNTLVEYDIQGNVQAILQRALKEAEVIGYIRWFNEINIFKLNFYRLGLSEFVVSYDINAHLNVDDYLNALNKRSKNKTRTLTPDDISYFVQNNQTDDLFNLCNGHDVTALITLMLDNKSTTQEQFCSVLRASFNHHYFRETKLYADILSWQTHYGFFVLRA